MAVGSMEARLTVLESLVSQLFAETITDYLTGALNRRGLNHHLRQLEGRNTTMVMIDIDHFKLINDTFGHHAGDEVLRSFYAFILRESPPASIMGRWGGDEFLVIVPDATPEQVYAHFLQMQSKSFTPTILAMCGWRCSFSAGIAFHKSGAASQESIQIADAAMYFSKKSARGRTPESSATRRLEATPSAGTEEESKTQ